MAFRDTPKAPLFNCVDVKPVPQRYAGEPLEYGAVALLIGTTMGVPRMKLPSWMSTVMLAVPVPA